MLLEDAIKDLIGLKYILSLQSTDFKNDNCNADLTRIYFGLKKVAVFNDL